MSEQNEVKREFVFATYTKSRRNTNDDLLVVKEYLHHPDGRIEPNLRLLNNYERSFYITKKEYQDHETKKEFEHLYKLEEYKSTQAGMVDKAKRLTKNYGARTITDINASPYLYGTDISTPVLLHYEYNKKWPELSTSSTLTVLDTETSVLHDSQHIICGSITHRSKAYLVVLEEFIERFDLSKVKDMIQEKFTYYLGDYQKSRNITLEIDIAKTSGEIATLLYKKQHKWQTDFLGFWNMSFDINKIITALDKENIPKELVFSDPKVPAEYKYFRWKEDQMIKMKTGGVTMTKHPADLWHHVTAPASFHHIDLMCLYKRLRIGKKQKNSYSLDAILQDELKIQKLKFKEADGLAPLDWHTCMQTEYPLEYLIYNLFDCISVELLDEKTNDVSKGLRANVDISEINKLNSNPKRLSDALYFVLLEQKKIIGSVSESMKEELDSLTFDLRNWILALAAELQSETGKKLIKEYPNQNTNIITHAFDIDIQSAYPTFGSILNISKGTSRYEVYGIEGLSEYEARETGINLSGIRVNAMDLAKRLYSFPNNDELLQAFMNE